MKRKIFPAFTTTRSESVSCWTASSPARSAKFVVSERSRTLRAPRRSRRGRRSAQDLASGRAIEGPLTLRQFVAGYYHLICASHAPATKKSQDVIIKNHLLRYFGYDELTTITSIRVIDCMADMRARNCSAHYINDAVRVLKILLRQAVERDVIADYPIPKLPKEKDVPLRLELKPDERARFSPRSPTKRRSLATSTKTVNSDPSSRVDTSRSPTASARDARRRSA